MGRQFLAILLTCASPWALSTEYRSIGDRPAVLYDAPSTRASKLAVLSRGQPVEMIVKLEKWTKVREVGGVLAWLENSALVEQRSVVVVAPATEIRAQPNTFAPIVFEAQRLVILDITGPVNDGWLPVRHRDGQQGFVLVAQVWGA